MGFEWDLGKAELNARKHDVTFSEATEIFSDVLSSTVTDPDHSDTEDRFVNIWKNPESTLFSSLIYGPK